jgi:hypothetical protein
MLQPHGDTGSSELIITKWTGGKSLILLIVRYVRNVFATRPATVLNWKSRPDGRRIRFAGLKYLRHKKGNKMTDKRVSVILLLLVSVLMAAVPAQAQEITATINGVVTDPSGGTVGGAKIVATDIDRGTHFSTATDAGGNYSLPLLPIGRYDVKVESTGFQTAIRRDVKLVLNQVAAINFQLQVGNLSQTIEVKAAEPLLQTEQTQVNSVMETNAILALPLQSRNYQQLALLTPGAVTTSPASFNSGQTTFNSGRPDT